MQTTAALAHPGIPAVHDTGTDKATGDLYLVMQLLTGAELADLIAEHDYDASPPPLAWAAAIAAQVATVLSEVHRLSVVHRDIKPRNLFLTPGGIVKVLDFGVAALLGAGELIKLTMTEQTVAPRRTWLPSRLSPVRSGHLPTYTPWAASCTKCSKVHDSRGCFPLAGKPPASRRKITGGQDLAGNPGTIIGSPAPNNLELGGEHHRSGRLRAADGKVVSPWRIG